MCFSCLFCDFKSLKVGSHYRISTTDIEVDSLIRTFKVRISESIRMVNHVRGVKVKVLERIPGPQCIKQNEPKYRSLLFSALFFDKRESWKDSERFFVVISTKYKCFFVKLMFTVLSPIKFWFIYMPFEIDIFGPIYLCKFYNLVM